MSDPDLQLMNELADARVRADKLELRYRGLLFMAGFLLNTVDTHLNGLTELIQEHGEKNDFKDIDEETLVKVSREFLKRSKNICRDLVDVRVSLVCEMMDPVLNELEPGQNSLNQDILNDRDREQLADWAKAQLDACSFMDPSNHMGWYGQHVASLTSFMMTMICNANDLDQEKLKNILLPDIMEQLMGVMGKAPSTTH